MITRRPAFAMALIVILLLLGGATVLGLQCLKDKKKTPPTPNVVIGMDRRPILSPATLADIDKTVKANRGSVVLVEFWASWCGPCRIQFPKTMDLHEKYKGLVVVTVALDDAEFAPTMQLKKWEAYTSTNLLYTGDLKNLVAPYGFPGYIPYLVLFDKTGKRVSFSDDTLDTLMAPAR